MKLFYALGWSSLVLLSFSAHSQMSRPSVFPEMRSYNPAVISKRPSGDYKLSASQTMIEKEQNVSNLDGNPFVLKDESDINLTNINFFRGGKGSGLTSELVVDYTTGERDSNVTDGSGSKSNYKTDTSTLFANYAFGFGKGLGLGLTYVSYESSFQFNGSLNGQAVNENYNSEVTVLGVKPGIVFGGKTAGIGLTFEYQKYSTDGQSGAPSKLMVFGAGVSLGTSKTLVELSLEVAPGADDGSNLPGEESKTPMKFSFLTEMKLSFITFGYKLNAYKDGFMELDKVIQNQLVYSNAGGDTRLEHIVNFSFGGDKGFNFGVSGSYSTSSEPEKNGLFFSQNKHPTETKEINIAAKVGFVF